MQAKAGAIVVMVAAFILGTPAFAQTRLNGVIRDSEGGVISGATIFIHWDSSGSKIGLNTNTGIKQDLILTTDSKGMFSAEMPPGFYDIFTSATAFSPDCKKIRIKNGEAATFNVQLKV